jgi:hypothetical protein
VTLEAVQAFLDAADELLAAQQRRNESGLARI